MKYHFSIIFTFFLISSLLAVQQSFAEETLDFENCNGFLSIEDVKSVIGDIDDLAVYSSAFMPVDGEPGLKTTCRATFESSDKTIGMTLVVMDSTDAAIALYQKNLDSIFRQDFEIREYLTFWNNFDVVLNDQGLGSLMGSQYDKFFISFHTSLDEDKRALADVEQLRVLSTIVQKKILDLDDISISLPNPVLDNDVGLTTDKPPISPPSLPPVEEGMLLSPKKQSSQGIEPAAVTCKEGLVLIIKHDGSPACVKHETAESLEERGWGVIPPPCCKTIHHDALDISQEFIISSPTFAFDGMDESLNLELVAIRESFPEQYVVEGEFSTLHGGYGDRTDQMIDQVITQHKMNLVVISGQVTSAIIDGKWNELEQTPLPWTPTKGPDETVSHGGPVVDYVSFIDTLRQKGITIIPGEQIIQPFFSVPGFSIDMNGQTVQVFEYETAGDAENDLSLISSDGSIGTSMPFWIDEPHFYYKERIIVLYVGSDPTTKNHLDFLLFEHLQNNTSSELSFITYTKEGGIAGIRESATIHMLENTLTQSSSQGQTETVLEDSQINFLLDLIEDSVLFREIYSEYPPSEGAADYFTYTLHFTNEGIDNFAVWTDTSSNVPEDLILVAQNIEKIKSEE